MAKPKEVDGLGDNAKTDDVQEFDTDGLVKVWKSGEALHVHPTAVEAHVAVGWEVV